MNLQLLSKISVVNSIRKLTRNFMVILSYTQPQICRLTVLTSNGRISRVVAVAVF